MSTAFHEARFLAEAARYADAERRLRDALAQDPGDADLLAYLSYVLRMLKRYPDALAAADAAAAAKDRDAAGPDGPGDRPPGRLPGRFRQWWRETRRELRETWRDEPGARDVPGTPPPDA